MKRNIGLMTCCLLMIAVFACGSQQDFDINATDANTGVTFRAAINAALQALASNNSGATAPTTTYPNQFWADTTAGILRQRNAANTAWVPLFALSSSSWIFVNDIMINGLAIGMGGGGLTTNTVLGKNALPANTTGQNNVAIGPSTLGANTTGASNIAIGLSGLAVNTTGNLNQAIGYMALALNTTGSGNTAIGYTALANNTTGFNNIGIGSEALGSMTTGAHNVAIGYQAGAFDSASGLNLTGTYSEYIGFDARPKTNGETNEIVIGYFARGAGSNTATIGSTNIVKTVLQGEVKCPGLSTGITTQTGATYTVPVTVTSIIANYAGTMTLTLPSPATYPGRIIQVKTVQNQAVVSTSANVVPLAGGSGDTAILAATAGKYVQLQSDGINWQIMMAN